MSDSRMKCKAGIVFFLLVCLCFCTACGSERAVFVAGEETIFPTVTEAETVQITGAAVESEVQQADVNLRETEESPKEEIPEASAKINLNTAQIPELVTLPGIGETRAAAIVQYREDTGAFREIEEIMNVKGIGPGIFSKISSLICVK